MRKGREWLGQSGSSPRAQWDVGAEADPVPAVAVIIHASDVATSFGRLVLVAKRFTGVRHAAEGIHAADY